MQYNQLIAISHDALLATRNIYYLITTELFSELYAKATDHDRRMVVAYVEHRDIEAVRKWIMAQQHVIRDYGGMTVRQLRKEAQNRHISDYHLMNKIELILELEDDDDEKRIDRESSQRVEDACNKYGYQGGDVGSYYAES